MKKTAKKISLCRETLKELDQPLGAAAVTNWEGCVWETGTNCLVSYCICP